MNRYKILVLPLLLVVAAVARGQETGDKLFSLEELNFGGTHYSQYVPEGRDLFWRGDSLLLHSGDTLYLVDITTLAETPLPPSSRAKDEGLAAAAHSSASGNRCTVDDHQLVLHLPEGTSRQITADGDGYNIVYGAAPYRNEFGTEDGFCWSNDGQKVAYYRIDQTAVTAYPQVLIPPSPGTIATSWHDKYPMVGQATQSVTVGIYDVVRDTTVVLAMALSPDSCYLTNIAWSADDRSLYLFEGPRGQHFARLVAYDTATGARKKVLYYEENDKYVEPLHPVYPLPWDTSQLVMFSRRDGYMHLYLISEEGDSQRQITAGEWEVLEMVALCADDESIIYTSNECGTRCCNLWKVSTRTGERTLLDDGKGWHRGIASTSGRYIIDVSSAPTVPRDISLITTSTARRVSYYTANDPWEGFALPQYTTGTIVAADDSTLLNYRLVLPPALDATKKYPTIVYVYGGPHAHLVDERWHYAARSWETYMAQRGYIIFAMDNRGSENRGAAFEQVSFHALGEEEMKDQMRGVDFLKTLPYVDEERLGVHGWSFGGFMTIALMTTYPDIFKVAVAGGPVIDWRYYEVMYGERYMGTPQENAAGYAATSLLTKVPNLRGHLQIIIGYNDNTVVPQHALSFLRACIDANIPVDFFVYPGQEHNMMGHDSVHLHQRISKYFFDYL